jgi:LacI family transcriptional regulator
MGDSPTIRDVALAANVAIGTVSRVLNGHKSVSDEVRRRVLKAIKKLKYEPDRVAQSMRLGVTRTVACATRDISMPGYGAIVYAAEEVLRSSGYTLLLATTDERKERELDLLRGKMREFANIAGRDDVRLVHDIHDHESAGSLSAALAFVAST